MRQLVAEGVSVVFGIPGEHNLALCDAVLDEPGLTFVGCRHEQSVAFMANGYARASGRVAAALVISGPGVTNALTGLADAYADAIPMVLLASSPVRRLVGRGAFHEMRDQTGALASVTRWNARVDEPAAIPDALRRAFARAQDGRPGPTAVEFPVDVQSEATTASVVQPHASAPCPADPTVVREAARVLHAAARPIVLVGGGAARAGCGSELVALVERLNAVCLSTALGKGVVPDEHPLHLGCMPLLGDPGCDLVASATSALVVGSGLDEVDTRGWTLPLPADLVQIDTCAEVLGRSYPVRVGLIGDARVVVEQLTRELAALEPATRPSPAPDIERLRGALRARLRDRPGWQIVDAMHQALGGDGIVTNDASIANAWVLAHLPRSRARSCFITRSFGALGFALPAAVGAKVAEPDRPVVAVVGDGGFLFTTDALATAVQYRLGVAVVIFNDGRFGSIGASQMSRFGRTVGVELAATDFVKLAESLGAAGRRVDTPDQLRRGLVEAFQRPGPTVFDVPWEADFGFV